MKFLRLPLYEMIFKWLIGKYPYIVITIFICSFFLYQIHRLSINFPYHDDYWAILETVADWKKTHNPTILFKLHNDQRILFIRSIAVLQYELFGAVNFKHLIFMSCLSIPALIFLFYCFAKKHFKITNNLALLPIPLLLCTYFYSEASLWAMCGLQHLWILVFVLLLVLLLKTEGRLYWLSIPLAFITIYSSGNGIFILIAGTIVSYQKLKSPNFLTWLGFTIIFLVAYFAGYSSKSPMGEKLFLVFHHVLDFCIFNLAFLGSALNPGEDHNAVMMCAFAAAAFLFVFVCSIYNNNKNTGLEITLAMLSFLFLSAFVASISRYPEGGIYVSIESRYKLYSLFFFCVIYIYWIANYPILQHSQILVIGLISFATSYNFYSYWLKIPLLYGNKNTVLYNLSVWEKGEAKFLGVGWDDTSGVKRNILLKADSLQIFPILKSQRSTLITDLKSSYLKH